MTSLSLVLALFSALFQDLSGSWRGEWKSQKSPGVTGAIKALLKQEGERLQGEIEFLSLMGSFSLKISEMVEKDKDLKISGSAQSKETGLPVKVSVVLKRSSEGITGTYEFPLLSDSGAFDLKRGEGKREVEFVPAKFGEAALEICDGLPIIRAKGSSKEIGTQLGHLLKPQIQFLIENYLPKMLGNRREKALKAARQMERHLSPRDREAMKALATEAKTAYEDILLANTAVELYQLFMCSTLAVRGSLTSDGALFFGRNLDFPSFGILEQYSVVVDVQSEEGHRFVSVTWPGLVGVLSGMNDKGVAVANLVAFSNEDATDGVPYMFLLRDVMERCSNVDEAIDLLQAARRTTANNIMVADASREAAVLELTHERANVRRIKKDRLFATNTFLKPGEKKARCGRYERMVKDVKAAEKLDVKGVTKILDAVDIASMNVQSMVFIPERRELYLSIGVLPAAGGTFVKVTIWKQP